MLQRHIPLRIKEARLYALNHSSTAWMFSFSRECRRDRGIFTTQKLATERTDNEIQRSVMKWGTAYLNDCKTWLYPRFVVWGWKSPYGGDSPRGLQLRRMQMRHLVLVRSRSVTFASVWLFDTFVLRIILVIFSFPVRISYVRCRSWAWGWDGGLCWFDVQQAGLCFSINRERGPTFRGVAQENGAVVSTGLVWKGRLKGQYKMYYQRNKTDLTDFGEQKKYEMKD